MCKNYEQNQFLWLLDSKGKLYLSLNISMKKHS